MAERFSNNAVGTLYEGISDTETLITLTDEPGAANFAALLAGDFQRATLYAQGDAGGAVEIVRIVSRDGLELTIERAQEDTAAVAWAAGAKIGARVTAAMLGSLAPKNGFEADPLASFGRQFRTTTNGGQFVVNGRVEASYRAVQLSGFHALQPVAAAVRDRSLDDGLVDINMARESVGATAFVELGDVEPPTWTSGATYGHGSRVKPATPTGYYYTLELAPGNDYSETTVAPAFDEFGSCPLALYGNDAEDESNWVGAWVAEPESLVVKDAFPGGTRLMVTEVGFICYSHGATTVPTVSIGTSASPTLLANAVALSQISGAQQVHRIPVNAGGPLHSNLVFTLNTPADAEFKGRFYWRGLIVGV